MNKENQAITQLSAPQVDNLIYGAEKAYEVVDNRTKNFVLELFHKLKTIAVCGDEEQRELWLTAPRGLIEDFGDYKEYLEDGEVECYEEFEAIWFSEYPETQKWYLLQTSVYKDTFSIFINHKLVLQIQPEPQRQYSYDISELARWLLCKVDDTIVSQESSKYNEYVNRNLPFRKRLGRILRENYWQIFPEEKAEYLRDIKPNEVSRFIELMKKQPADCSTFRLSEMTAALFFHCCRLGYEANNYNGIDHLTSKELYLAHADGRDDGLLNLEESSAIAFDEWYHDTTHYGGHPWEVCRGGNSTHISLYACHDEKGWWFRLAGSSQGRSVETVKFYMALADHNLPVYLSDGKEIAAMLNGIDYIGIVPEGIFPRYCGSLFPGEKILTFMNLRQEKQAQVVKAAIWYPLRNLQFS